MSSPGSSYIQLGRETARFRHDHRVTAQHHLDTLRGVCIEHGEQPHMKEFWTKVSETLRRLADGFLDVASIVALGVDSAYQLLEALSKLSSRYAWCFTPSVEFHAIAGIASAARNAKAPHRVIHRLVRNYLLRDDWFQLRRIVSEMDNYSIMRGRRCKIIRDCIIAMQWHGMRGFNAATLVVPTLFAQIDGVITEFAHEVGIPKWNDRKQNGPQNLRRAFEVVTYAFDKPALDLIFEVLFAPSRPAVSLARRRLNRHKILHGQWLEYGRLEHVLRTILIVDFLGYAIEEYRERHRSGDWDTAVTEKSQYSKMLSENPISSLVPLAKQRVVSRSLVLPPGLANYAEDSAGLDSGNR
jgi:hypothetical protein